MAEGVGVWGVVELLGRLLPQPHLQLVLYFEAAGQTEAEGCCLVSGTSLPSVSLAEARQLWRHRGWAQLLPQLIPL